ncbi:MAG: sigma-70 family RNA polymerase sigma factor [Alicyclobacillaceae bacterium]|nr:sigma-70 family RNA polymerase sigma factor [Alicyclobacillaceae bacterium]
MGCRDDLTTGSQAGGGWEFARDGWAATVRAQKVAALVERHQSWLIHLAAAYLGSLHSAQDCVQDVFVMALTKLDPTLPEASIRSWLATCTVNRARSMLRAARLRRLVSVDRLYARECAQADVYPSLDETGVLAKVMELPVRNREVLVLRYYHDLDIATIAQVLSMSENTVKTRLRRAKERLRRSLDETAGG